MILTGQEILSEYEAGRIYFSEFDSALIGTNSYDLKIGSRILVYDEEVLDPRKNNKFHVETIPKNGLTLPADSFILGESSIKLGSDSFVPIIHGRSSIARLGVFVHITADLIDIGFFGKSTFQIHNLLPITLYPDMTIAQVTFWVPKGEINLYNGKYQGAEGPISSRIFHDFRANQ